MALGTVTLTQLIRRSLAALIRDAAAAQGVSCVHAYSDDGRNGYILNGRWMTPGQAADALNINWPSPTGVRS